MIRISLYIVFLFANSVIYSQIVGFERFNDTVSSYLDFSALYDGQASGIQNNISTKFFRGGEITEDDKISILDHHKKLNRIGREMKSDLIFCDLSSNFFGLKKYGWMYNLGYHSVFSGHYSKDIMNLALNGNSNSLGDTMDFGGSTFQQMTYQYLGVGVQDKKTKSYLSLNVVNLQSYFYGNLDGEMFTSADTSHIYLKTKGNFRSTYKSKISNGIGVSINFVLNIQVPIFSNRNTCFQLKVSDFGVARVSALSNYNVDTSLSYNGFEVRDLMNFQQVSFEKNQWMDTLNIKSDTLAKWLALPVMLQFSKILVTDSTSKFQTFFGVKSYPTLSYFPKIFAGVDFKLNSSLFSGISLSYGGFGGFRAGIYGRLNLQKLQLYIGAEDVYGLVSKNGFGQNVNLRFVCNL